MSEAKPFELNCPKCGAGKVGGERNCLNCGHDLYAIGPEAGGPAPADGPSPQGRRKSMGLTIVLAIIFPGLGHLYVGRWGRGLTIMAGFVIVLLAIASISLLLGASVVGLVCVPLMIIVGVLLFVPFEIWQILDAMSGAAAANMGRA